mgnify:CR=1 FL=1
MRNELFIGLLPLMLILGGTTLIKQNKTSELEFFKSNLEVRSLFTWSIALTNSCLSNSETTSKLQSLAMRRLLYFLHDYFNMNINIETLLEQSSK